jgi:hypothetical protein
MEQLISLGLMALALILMVANSRGRAEREQS